MALGAIERRGLDDFFRDDLVFQDFLVVVNVVDEFVEGVDALLQAALDPVPFLGADDARNQVEGKNASGARRIATMVGRTANMRRALA